MGTSFPDGSTVQLFNKILRRTLDEFGLDLMGFFIYIIHGHTNESAHVNSEYKCLYDLAIL